MDADGSNVINSETRAVENGSQSAAMNVVTPQNQMRQVLTGDVDGNGDVDRDGGGAC